MTNLAMGIVVSALCSGIGVAPAVAAQARPDSPAEWWQGITLTAAQRDTIAVVDAAYRQQVRARLDSAYRVDAAPRRRPALTDLTASYLAALRALLTDAQRVVFAANLSRVAAAGDSASAAIRQRAASRTDSVSRSAGRRSP